MNKPSPSLTNVYLDTPIVGPTPDTLEYASRTGRIGQPHEYPPTGTEGVPHTSAAANFQSSIWQCFHPGVISQSPEDRQPNSKIGF